MLPSSLGEFRGPASGSFSYENLGMTLCSCGYMQTRQSSGAVWTLALMRCSRSIHIHSCQVPSGLWIQNGLLDEVRELTRLASSSNESNEGNSDTTAAAAQVNFTFGVFQSIGKFGGFKRIMPNRLPIETGFREFHRYLADPSPSETRYQTAVQNLKTANHQYAKRQVTWIRNKLLPAVRTSKSTEGSMGVEMYLLDATGSFRSSFEIRDWTTQVFVRVHRASKMDT